MYIVIYKYMMKLLTATSISCIPVFYFSCITGTLRQLRTSVLLDLHTCTSLQLYTGTLHPKRILIFLYGQTEARCAVWEFKKSWHCHCGY